MRKICYITVFKARIQISKPNMAPEAKFDEKLLTNGFDIFRGLHWSIWSLLKPLLWSNLTYNCPKAIVDDVTAKIYRNPTLSKSCQIVRFYHKYTHWTIIFKHILKVPQKKKLYLVMSVTMLNNKDYWGSNKATQGIIAVLEWKEIPEKQRKQASSLLQATFPNTPINNKPSQT